MRRSLMLGINSKYVDYDKVKSEDSMVYYDNII